MSKSILDECEKYQSIDKSNMINYSINSTKYYGEAADLAESIKIDFPKPENLVVAGMGGSAIGGDLLKDWAKNRINIPIEVSREYELPAYANQKTLVLVTSYSGDTEETLNAFLDALQRKCMIFCVSSGGSLIEHAQRLKVPYLKVPSGIPPRAALPYMFIPLLKIAEKTGLVSGVSRELSEAFTLLEKVSRENSPQKLVAQNLAKTLAQNINQTSPIIYGFGMYRSVAIRFKQQFNENSKIPAKWEVFSELNHNETVGWERADKLAKCFSTIFIRDRQEPVAIRSRIEISKELVKQAGVGVFEVEAQGQSSLARMLSTILVGDFTSVYLALLHNVDPTPVNSVNYLKDALKQNGVKEETIAKLAKLKKA